MTILVVFSSLLSAEDKRVIPLDMYLIMDSSSSFQSAKAGAADWLNGQVVDRIFTEGDKVTIWAAGDSAEVVYSGQIGNAGEKSEIKDKIQALTTDGRSADFQGALRDLQQRLSVPSPGRMPYTMLVIATAGGIGSAISGSYQSLLRWSRSEKYEGWQALILAPDIGRKVSQAAQNYMNSQR